MHTWPMGESGSSLLIFLAVTSKFLDLLLSLASFLWMLPGGQAYRDPEQTEEGFPHMGNKLQAAVRDDIFWYPKVPEDMGE